VTIVHRSYSILIPTKDRPKLLLRAVVSALRSKTKGLEVIVIDDGGIVPAKQTLKHIQDQRLYIVQNQRAAGASGARNFGASKAVGDVIFFLDDDDEINVDYCRRIVALNLSSDYGFSSYMTEVDGHSQPPVQSLSRVRFPEGPIPKSAPLNRQLFGFGMGFWIRRSVFKELGDIDEYLQINEDTEYGCRLIAANKSGWYSAEPGVVVHKHEGVGDGELLHITDRISPEDRAEFFLYVSEKYPEFRSHLGRGYVKYCIKSSQYKKAWGYAAEQKSLIYRINFSVLIVIKFLGYMLTGKL